MQKFSIKTIVAIGIGAALFFVLHTYVAIPTPIPNTRISLDYPVLAVLAMLFGPVAGLLIGTIGHALSDLVYGGIWWSWVAGSAFFGLAMGLLGTKLKLNDGDFGPKGAVVFNIYQIIAHFISWNLLATVLDIVFYDEPYDKLLLQNMTSTIGNAVSTAIVGTILCFAYVAARPKKGSLKKDD